MTVLDYLFVKHFVWTIRYFRYVITNIRGVYCSHLLSMTPMETILMEIYDVGGYEMRFIVV